MEPTTAERYEGTETDTLREHVVAPETSGLETRTEPATNNRPKRGPRTRMARWETVIGTQSWRFCYDPRRNVLMVRKKHSRKLLARDITMPELIEALDGKKLLPVL